VSLLPILPIRVVFFRLIQPFFIVEIVVVPIVVLVVVLVVFVGGLEFNGGRTGHFEIGAALRAAD
jgi:hypothetical protein